MATSDSFWDSRFSEPGFAYGTGANEFLRRAAVSLTGAQVLCLAEGEGRNAVYLAELGNKVTAVDLSAVGLAKAQMLAQSRSVEIDTLQADIAELQIEPASWDAIVSIFAHFPPAIRRELHQKVVRGLRPGGRYILEGYTVRQLLHGTGGPKDPELLYSIAELRRELIGLRFDIAQETEREIHEGRYHNGLSAVAQLIAVKPD